ncbi:MAG: hypothetical protein K6A92_06150 [Lachnospiraceae bacterium]|nr:hypothetical protein [Lachnospiraceae bacterium]
MARRKLGSDQKFKKDHSGEATLRYMNESAMDMGPNTAGAPIPVTQTVSYGEDQGGILDWFRNLFGRRRRQEEPMAISGPQEVKGFATPFATSATVDPSKAGKVNQDRDLGMFWQNGVQQYSKVNPGLEGLQRALAAEFNGLDYKQDSFNASITHAGDGWSSKGLNKARVASLLTSSTLGEGMTQDQVMQLMRKLSATVRTDLVPNNPVAAAEADDTVDSGMRDLKQVYYRALKRAEATYGTLGTQMHPEDYLRQIGPEFGSHFALTQDTEQMLVNAPHLFDMENSEEDRDFKRLSDYYNQLYVGLNQYGSGRFMAAIEGKDTNQGVNYAAGEFAKADPAGIGGPSMDPKAQAKYLSGMRRRAKRQGWMSRLFGNFLSPSSK